jgi:hypothetical protein
VLVIVVAVVVRGEGGGVKAAITEMRCFLS